MHTSKKPELIGHLMAQTGWTWITIQETYQFIYTKKILLTMPDDAT
jgi:hypothetical protein